jgi:cold shock protein
VAEGTVRWFNATKGFGFISPSSGGDDLFVHQSEIQEYDRHGLTDNQRVEFEVAQGRKGLQATAVRVVRPD